MFFYEKNVWLLLKLLKHFSKRSYSKLFFSYLGVKLTET